MTINYLSQKIAKLISVFTVVPIIALLVITIIYLNDSSFFHHNLNWYLMSIFFLVIVPLSAYWLKNYIPKYRQQGREGERKLAFITGIIGQFFGTVTVFILNGPVGVKLLFLTYILAGILLTICNSIIKFRASGHACGVAGPLTFLIFILGKNYLASFILLPLVFWSRLKLRRHTMSELVLGALLGVIATVTVVY